MKLFTSSAYCIAFIIYSSAVPTVWSFLTACSPPQHARKSITTRRPLQPQASSVASDDILLRIKFSIQPGKTAEEAKERISKYSQSFPFSAVLPVQPLMYLPMDDHGVEVRFLRKKTDIKSGIDGGIRFYIQEDKDFLEVTAMRNSEGQTIPKLVAERLVITSFVKGIQGEEEEGDKYGDAPTDVVEIQSIFHKWMWPFDLTAVTFHSFQM